MKDKKKIVIGTLCALIMVMTVGYALLAQTLSITGSASITSNWQVEITNITEKEKSTGATTNNTNYTATTASFNTSLTSPGDYALYEVTVTNKGTLDAVLSAKPTVTTGNNEAIQYELEGIKKGDKILKNNQTDTFTIKVTYNPSTTTQPNNLTSNIEVTLNYEQDLGQVGTYDEYVIGDKITFAGSDWYVINNSTDKDDYVVAMREKVLSQSEFGQTDYCGGFEHTQTRLDQYLNIIGEENLKEVEGYKIREITNEELAENFDCIQRTVGTQSGILCSDDTPTWIYDLNIFKYSNTGGDRGVVGYWTMTKVDDNNGWFVMNRIGTSYGKGGLVQANYSRSESYLCGSSNGTTKSIRPVINLLKSAIE